MKYARLIQILAGHPFYIYVYPQGDPEKVDRLRIVGVWKNPWGCFHIRAERPECPGTILVFGQIDPNDEFFVPLYEDPLGDGLTVPMCPTPHVIKCLDLSALED